MKKNIILISVFTNFVLALFLISTLYEKNSLNNNTLNSGTISMLVETEVGSGVYTEIKEQSLVMDGYKFNEIKSKCENGAKIYWDKKDQRVVLKGNSSDSCYAYFDIQQNFSDVCSNQNLAQCIKANYEIDENIVYHKNLENSAEDESYRYTGSYETVNNYVCFGSDETSCPWDNMYRIIGVFGDQVKLIKADYANEGLLGTDGDRKTDYGYNISSTSNTQYKGAHTRVHNYFWNNLNDYANTSKTSTNEISESRLFSINLNKNYLSSFSNEWQSKIATTAWKVGGLEGASGSYSNAKEAVEYEIINPTNNTTYSAKIGLMYVSDYYYGAIQEFWNYPGLTNSSNPDKNGNYGPDYDYRAAIKYNWMYNGLWEWTISKNANKVSAYSVNSTGYLGWNVVYESAYAIRPVFYLQPNIILTGGDGSRNSPYTVS